LYHLSEVFILYFAKTFFRMTKYRKWLGGGLGWALGGPLGAILGFAIGALLDEAQIKMHAGTRTLHRSGTGDFTASLLVLTAAVMKSDGRTMKSELEYVRQFFVRQFGAQKANDAILLLKEILKQEIPLTDVCAQVKRHMPYSSRLQLIHYLYGISNSDGELHPQEISTIERIARLLEISSADAVSIRNMYYRDSGSDYRILEISENASDEEVKKAYRKMAMKFHPDRVAGLGEEHQKAAKEKFQKVQQAYENIKKQRRMA
jgi:DnaJ like chaperone protein